MEGRREEYLASRVPKPIAHIAEVEESQPDIEESTINNEEDTLHNEFAAMSLGTSNNIFFPLMPFRLSLKTSLNTLP